MGGCLASSLEREEKINSLGHSVGDTKEMNYLLVIGGDLWLKSRLC